MHHQESSEYIDRIDLLEVFKCIICRKVIFSYDTGSVDQRVYAAVLFFDLGDGVLYLILVGNVKSIA